MTALTLADLHVHLLPAATRKPANFWRMFRSMWTAIKKFLSWPPVEDALSCSTSMLDRPRHTAVAMQSAWEIVMDSVSWSARHLQASELCMRNCNCRLVSSSHIQG